MYVCDTEHLIDYIQTGTRYRINLLLYYNKLYIRISVWYHPNETCTTAR